MISTNKDASLFWLTPVQAATLAHEEGPKASPFWMVGSCISLTEGAKHLHKLKSCFRTGVGMKYDDYGEDMGCGICRELSVWTRHHLLSHVHKIAGAAAAPGHPCNPLRHFRSSLHHRAPCIGCNSVQQVACM